MNQDNYLGEAYKMRNLLECFKGRVRIVGFREHIFSEKGGAVAEFAANNEFVFGTMVQRFLTWPLCVRFHYGHPDVWDKVWALSSGGVSKASKTLHVSEDIYGGLNAVLRGGGVEYEEYIHCGKGRDITFAAANSFEQKISGGNAWQGMSRDFHRAARSFDLFRLLSLFVTGTGLFASSSLMFWALGWFILALTGFALVGLESFTVDGDEVYFDLIGTGGSEVYSAQWFVQLGFTLVFPLFLENAGALPSDHPSCCPPLFLEYVGTMSRCAYYGCAYYGCAHCGYTCCCCCLHRLYWHLRYQARWVCWRRSRRSARSYFASSSSSPSSRSVPGRTTCIRALRSARRSTSPRAEGTR